MLVREVNPLEPVVMYNPKLTVSVLERLSGVATSIRRLFAFSFGVTGAVFGAFLAASVGYGLQSSGTTPQSLVPFGLGGGGAVGVGIGLAVAHLVVVWVEWAQQVLGALHAIAAAVHMTGVQPASPSQIRPSGARQTSRVSRPSVNALGQAEVGEEIDFDFCYHCGAKLSAPAKQCPECQKQL
jgi:hypothetical protein